MVLSTAVMKHSATLVDKHHVSSLVMAAHHLPDENF